MSEDEREAARLLVRTFMSSLANKMAVNFPHHSAAMKQILGGSRMTTDRWNKIACLLSSLYSVPGVGLSPKEHNARNTALSAIPIAQKMAASSLGCTRDPDGCMDFARWLSIEIGNRPSFLEITV